MPDVFGIDFSTYQVESEQPQRNSGLLCGENSSEDCEELQMKNGKG